MKKTYHLALFLIFIASSSFCGPLVHNSLEIGADLFFRINLEAVNLNFNDYTVSPCFNYYFTKYFYIGAAYEIGTVFYKKENNYTSKNATVSSWDLHIGFTFPQIFHLFPYFYVGFGQWTFSQPINNIDSLQTYHMREREGWSLIPVAVGFKYNFWNNFFISPNYKFYQSYCLTESERGFIYRHAFSMSLTYLISFGKR